MDATPISLSISFPFLLSLFLTISSSSSSAATFQYQTLVLTSLPKPKTLSWPTLQDSETQFQAESQTTLSLDLHHLDNLSPDFKSTPQSLFKLRLRRDAIRVKASPQSPPLVQTNVSGQPPAAGEGDFSSSVISGLAQGSGEYFTRIGIGTPPKYVYMVLDTGSDVVWVQCSPCRKCYSQTDPVFDPKASSSFLGVSCGSPLCRRLDSPGCNNRQKCLYQVSYGDAIFHGVRRISRFEKCGFHPTVDESEAGHVLLRRIKRHFSGRSPCPGHYAVAFQDGPDGQRWCNSGFGHFRHTSDRPAYVALRDAFRAGATNLKRAPDFSLFDTCFDLSGKTEVKVPTVVLHFEGADVSLPASNYLIPVDSEGKFCFAFAGTMSGLSIIGNIQQQGFRVVFDMANNRVGFAARGCA
ncbi:UNVERIFIED_CONTAM: Aspartyl protease family protein 2 [Sesamum calycinum]|uniref:Aspartyl protease family protein 2 n=1 Tax=Sesamum calycinum TaxID=2727403 RepID=A0AAW2NWM2_9LAMI